MQQVYLTTTGKKEKINISGFEFKHPVKNLPLIYPEGFMSWEELKSDEEFIPYVRDEFINLIDDIGGKVVSKNDLTVQSNNSLPYYDYTEKTKELITTGNSTLYIEDKFTVPDAGLYKISYIIVIRSASSSRNMRFRVDLDNKILITNPGGDGYFEIEMKDTHNDIRHPFAGSRSIKLDPGTYTVRLRFGPELRNRSSVVMYFASIDILRVG